MRLITGADIRPAKCGHYMPIRPGRGLQPEKCAACKAKKSAGDRFEWDCRECDDAGGEADNGLLALVAWLRHCALRHPGGLVVK